MENDTGIGLANRVTIRAVRAEDAETIALLSASLGYFASEDEIRSRIEQLAKDNERTALAAVLQGEVVGWVEAGVERHLQSASVVVIGGLVVRNDMRGRRIGQQLCRTVEEWAVQIGIATVRVRSQLKRVDAHRFYLRDGYTQVKVSAVLEKHLLRQP